jgi:DNA-binding NtrC family response regulator/serine/threonine protein kinase/Tfp pilus assembly protein PilF
MAQTLDPVCVVDDDASIREAVKGLIRSAGWKARTFKSARDFLARRPRVPASCLVLDVDLPGLSGLDLQQQLVKERDHVPIIFLTGRGDIPMSVRAIKNGALEFLTKPFDDEQLLTAIRLAITQRPVTAARGANRPKQRWDIVGSSAPLKAVLEQIEKVAATELSVLIMGETGTGKELAARTIHHRSNRRNRAFVSVNCAAIPSALIASELFGHEKGAFAGALQKRIGRFELAEGGTIFLDEVGDLTPEAQALLLRVLQERQFERVGGNEIIAADVRVIAATRRDLQVEIAGGAFRSDLFYRLNVFPITMPPLRERKEDIPALVDFFIRCRAQETGEEIRGAKEKTLEDLQAYSWPGNVRELQNVIERSLVICDKEEFSVRGTCLASMVKPKTGRNRTDTVGRASVMNAEHGIAAGVCARCGKSITHPGPDGECVRCLVRFGFLAEDEEAERRSEGNESRLGPLRYAHFEIEVNPDGFPVILGSGAMAITYLARDTILNSQVALKVISRKLAEDSIARARFLREARAAAQIHHPNVARVIHYGEQDGECFYAMELVEGETLEARVQRDGPLPVSLALEIVEQTARGLAAGEERGVIHRDLKPSNLMIESHADDQLLVKIIDYGIAKIVATQDATIIQTQAGFLGTPAFASPEQFAGTGQQIDARSDVYSLGATFWYLLTGQLPFAGSSIEEVRAKQEAALPVKQLKNARVPHACVNLLQSMLALSPAERPQTARQLLNRVHHCCSKFSTEARARRRRSMLIASLSSLVIAAIAVGAWLYQHTQSASRFERSIAILPFENLSSDKENAYFTDGVQDEILTHLAKVADLKVISRTSVMQYKSGIPRNLRKIGEELGVAHVVEGSVQRSGNKVRVNTQLLDARNDRHEWAENYDRPIDDVFAIQSEIAKAIADQLEARLSPAEKNIIAQRPTADVVAFEEYSKAKTLMLTEGAGGALDRAFKEAAELFKSSIARDPAFHAALCQLVRTNDLLYAQGYDHTAERLSAAEEALKKAAELRPDSADTHLARAQHFYFALRDYKSALAELELARPGLPNDPRVLELTGYILRREGKAEQGLQALQQAAHLDPRNTSLLNQNAASFARLRRYFDAAATLDRALRIKPGDVRLGALRAEMALVWRADPEPMWRFVERVRNDRPELIPDVVDNWFRSALAKRDWADAEQALAALGDNPLLSDGPIQPKRDFGEGLLARAMHDEARARRAFTAARAAQEQVVQKQNDYAPALCLLGLIDAGLGNKEAALEEGRRASELLPVAKDAVQGAIVKAYFAMIAAWTGQNDLALEQLSAVVHPGAFAPFCTHYGMLKSFPFWDPLRGDPRFENFVASLAPKN